MTPKTPWPTTAASCSTVTKDQLNTGLNGQIRYRVSEQNLYAYLFGVKQPLVHVMGCFISVLRERIANFEAPDRPAESVALGSQPLDASIVTGVSINDLRKNLRDLNEHMDATSGAHQREFSQKCLKTLNCGYNLLYRSREVD